MRGILNKNWPGVAVAFVAALVLLSVPAAAKDSMKQLLTDADDGKFDISEYLARGGFIPVPIIITEPALGQGLGVAATFLDYSGLPDGEDPTISVLGVAATGNGSKGALAFRSGSFRQGRFKYAAALGGGSVNMTFYPTGNRGFTFNNRAKVAYLEGRMQIGKSAFYLGPSITLANTKIRPDFGSSFPIPPALTQDIQMNALGILTSYDSLDNPLTPRNGLNFNAHLRRYDDVIGSDANFDTLSVFGAGFRSPNPDWTFGGMVLGNATSGSTPFFMEPSIAIRGVPLNRYQGDRVLSSEVEIRRQLNPRWSVLGFAGYGRATANGSSSISKNNEVFTGGLGVRYRIAKRFGLDMGLDVAVGPEDTIVYIQLGHAWGRNLK
ncbi:hypothetical protein Q4578_07560 [Shimia thalassica]|uniref:hypothetical protein n=1 Tax=Shimia thalassica TaxID=1715693 RepID=UPI0026E20550|nr:hypothetical protein [Shimia thalassica]MDO6521437.1 hypothetical protein [Shimia thalassica]